MLDGLSGYVEAIGDLRVGQAGAQEPKDLGLPFREGANSLGARPDGRSERSENRRCSVGVSRRLQALELLKRRFRFGDRYFWRPLTQRTSKLEARAGELHRQLCTREPLEGVVEADTSIVAAVRDAHLALRQRGSRLEIGSSLRARHRSQALSGPLRLLDISLPQVDVDEEGQQGTNHGGLADRGDLLIAAFRGA